jgi:hypothetical protein
VAIRVLVRRLEGSGHTLSAVRLLDVLIWSVAS